MRAERRSKTKKRRLKQHRISGRRLFDLLRFLADRENKKNNNNAKDNNTQGTPS